MSFNSSSGTVNVTGNVTAIPSKRTLSHFNLTKSGAGDSNTVTVTAGKTWRIMGILMTTYNASAAPDRIQLLIDAVLLAAFRTISTATVFGQQSVYLPFTYDSAMVATANQVFKFNNAQSSNTDIDVYYYEE